MVLVISKCYCGGCCHYQQLGLGVWDVMACGAAWATCRCWLEGAAGGAGWRLTWAVEVLRLEVVGGATPHSPRCACTDTCRPSLRFQLVMRGLLSTMVSQWGLFSRTVWKKDCGGEKGPGFRDSPSLLRLGWAESFPGTT